MFNYTKYAALPAYNINANVDALYNFANVDSIEFYSRFALLEAKKDYNTIEPLIGEVKASLKIRQPYQIGIRYTFSF